MKYALPFLAAALAALALAGCLPIAQPVTIEERIQLFTEDLNTPGVNMQVHFSPSETTSYDQIAEPAYWDASPLAATWNPVIVINTVSGTTVTADFTNDVPVAVTIVFEMTTNGLDYVIKTLDYDNGFFQVLMQH